jgi:guanosine-3',5'-bis(diphosphate) 3'-pyrophosphohydrolase
MELHHLERFSSEDRNRIARAVEYAKTRHQHQTRLGGGPYIVHPIGVAQRLIDKFSADADTVIAGLLHDTVEDTGASLDEIETLFGPVVRFLVDGVTDVGEGDGGEKISDKIHRARATEKKASGYGIKDPRVFIIKIADRTDNMYTVSVHSPRGQVGYSRATLNFHVRICRELGYESQADELQRLCEDTIARWPQYQ